MKSKTNQLLLFICLITIHLSCTRTTREAHHPVFTNQAQAESELVGLAEAENINLSGIQSTTNGQVSTELEVAVINGMDLPLNADQQNALQKSIASSIRRNLQDSNQFDIYKVLFVEKTESNGLTKSKSTGRSFEVSEL